MLVQAMSKMRADITIGNSSNLHGFQVNAPTEIPYFNNQLRQISQYNRNPSEADVLEAARLAGESSKAKQLYQDYLNFEMERAQNIVAMESAEMNANGRLAGMAAQLNQAQNKMVRSFADANYKMGKNNSYTDGIQNAYSRGMNAAKNLF